MRDKHKQVRVELPVRLENESDGIFMELDSQPVELKSEDASASGKSMDPETYQLLWDDRIATGG